MHAAVMADNGWIFIGKCHADCFYKLDHISLKPFHGAQGQGFVTNKGRFVFRTKAADIAFKSGQISRERSMLVSEDLWEAEHEGEEPKYDYNEIEGYVLKTIK